MTSHWSTALLAAAAFAGILSAQDNRVIQDAIGDFRGVAKKTKDSNPVLATVEKGPAALLGAIGLGKSKPQGAGPIQVTLSKEQQEDVERRRKLAEKAELDAQKKPAARPKPVTTAKAAYVPVGPSAPVAVQPVAPPQPAQPPMTIVTPESLAAIATGMERDAVVTALGKPSAVSTIAGLEGGTRETLIYHLDPQHRAMVKLLDGKVQSVAR